LKRIIDKFNALSPATKETIVKVALVAAALGPLLVVVGKTMVGVGKLMQIATEGGRKTRPDIKLGICGEHGGDPSSIHFCNTLNFSYVSCSPFRVPIARLAAAQAAILQRK